MSNNTHIPSVSTLPPKGRALHVRGKKPAADSKARFLTGLASLSASLRHHIAADCAEFPSGAAASEKRRAKACRDFAFFRKTYFPHYVVAEGGDSALHSRLDRILPAIADNPQGVRLAVAAPRGEAKSTFAALFFPLWCLVSGRKRYMLLIADTREQSAALLEAVKAELETNPRLTEDFPEHCGRGHTWNVWTAVSRSGVKIQALGAGKKMRGLRHGACRPDLVILDDLENDENVVSVEQRDKLQDWLQKTVLNLGPPDGSLAVVYVGTVLHYDSVLARTLKKPGWRSLIIRAVIAWPHRMDLWDVWESVYAASGRDAARGFYREREKTMNEGAAVSWPGMRPLYSLMLLRAEDHAAFDSEQQNDPLAGDAAPFAACIHFWPERDGEKNWLPFGSIDPSLGKHGAGRDPSAILVGGLHRETMTLRVLEASITKRHPDAIIADAIALHKQYGCLLWAVEAVQFQEFFADVLRERAIAQGIALPVRPVKVHTDKRLRIESLQPLMAQKRILLHPSQATLIHQLRHFPKADHDDGPDALHQLWDIATKGLSTLAPGDMRHIPRNTAWRGFNT